MNNSSGEKSVSIDDFYVAKPDVDNAESINKALKKGKHILFTPGIYSVRTKVLKLLVPEQLLWELEWQHWFR